MGRRVLMRLLESAENSNGGAPLIIWQILRPLVVLSELVWIANATDKGACAVVGSPL